MYNRKCTTALQAGCSGLQRFVGVSCAASPGGLPPPWTPQKAPPARAGCAFRGVRGAVAPRERLCRKPLQTAANRCNLREVLLYICGCTSFLGRPLPLGQRRPPTQEVLARFPTGLLQAALPGCPPEACRGRA
eukprot:1153610-Alexandrium_andersonii.AAC.1